MHTPSIEEVRRHWGLAVDVHRREERLAEFDRMIDSVRAEGWENAHREVSYIPCWIKDWDDHGFDLWTDENGYAQESGARIEVMKVLRNNPYTEDYVDPLTNRPKRSVHSKRREGK